MPLPPFRGVPKYISLVIINTFEVEYVEAGKSTRHTGCQITLMKALFRPQVTPITYLMGKIIDNSVVKPTVLIEISKKIDLNHHFTQNLSAEKKKNPIFMLLNDLNTYILVVISALDKIFTHDAMLLGRETSCSYMNSCNFSLGWCSKIYKEKGFLKKVRARNQETS